MNKKQVLYGSEAKQALLNGSKTISQAVVSTLGPRSKNVAIKGPSSAVIVHDGVTVASNMIPLEDEFENLGAMLLLEASAKTNGSVGDGTTTSTLLAYTLLVEGMELLNTDVNEGFSVSPVNAMELKEQLDVYVKKIIDKLDKKAKKFSKKDIKEVASISASNVEIAELVSTALNKVGEDGLVMIESSSSLDSAVEFQEGMEFDNGYLSPYFITNGRKATCDYEDCYVLLTDYRIADPAQIENIINKVQRENKRGLMIIADDVQGTALQAMVLSKLRQGTPLVAVVAPEYADRRKDMLEDLASLTGGTVFSADRRDNLKDIELNDLGRASISVSKDKTIITPTEANTEDIKERIEYLKGQVEEATTEFKKDRVKRRLAKLTQGVAVIKVGGASEAEIFEKKERAIDAVHAVKAAMDEGVIAGGGVALYAIANEITGTEVIDGLVKKTLKAPFKTILENSGVYFEDTELSDEDINNNIGYNVITREKTNMLESNILDPVKVTKLAVQHAFSIAGIMLTTDTLVVNKPEEIQKMQVMSNK